MTSHRGDDAQRGDHGRAYGVAPPGYRLPDAAHVAGVRLQVSDLQRSVEYYERVLGLRVHHSTGDTASLGPNGDAAVLVTVQAARGIRPARRGAFGLYHFAVLLPDRPALGRFAAHLSSLGVRAGMADHLVSEALYLSDPDGLGIEVYADRPRSAWQHRGGELAMATDPLDISDVIAAAAGAAWEGAPSGTIMGHVHLHVGSLEEAEVFYHQAIGFDKMVWSYPGALFLAAGGYHHHLGTNIWSPGPAPAPDQAQLLEWELRVPSAADVAAAQRSVREAGFEVQDGSPGIIVADPWHTRVRITAER